MNRGESQAVNRLIIRHGRKVKLLEDRITNLQIIAILALPTGISIGVASVILYYSYYI
jgi:hypothetical protein